MKRSISILQAQAFDKYAQDKLGIPSIVLMENAGRGVAEEALKMVRGMRDGERKNVAVVCGTGNNGGDGLVAARHLKNAGVTVRIFMIGEKRKLKNDPKINYNIAQKMGLRIKWIKVSRDLTSIKGSDLIIDAIFGIGLNAPVTGLYLETIKVMNNSRVPILSVDVPSGLNADTGKAMGAAVRAKRTVTFVGMKKGLLHAIVRDIF